MNDSKYLKEITCCGVPLLRPTHEETRLIRKLVFERLPKNWDIKTKTKLASKVSKGNGAHYSEFSSSNLLRQLIQAGKNENKAMVKFRGAIDVIMQDFSRPSAYKDYYRKALKAQNMTHDQLIQAIDTLALASMYAEPINIPKQESKNITTERGQYDLFVGELLVSHGVKAKTAAQIISAIRTRYPFVAAYENDPVIVIDEKKEANSIYRRLLDAGIK
jgi:hypothetical protein